MLKASKNVFYADGEWWYRQRCGVRQRARIRTCGTCCKEFASAPSASSNYCSLKCYRKPCKRCDNEFKPRTVRQVYCSDACKQGTGTCGECGKEFVIGKKAKGLFCSTECFYESQVPTGTRRVQDDGYVLIKVPPDTPGVKRNKTTQSRWMFEHRYVMQQKLGRALLPNERVHHKYGDRSDNDPDRLELTVVSGVGKDKHVPGQRISDLIKYLVTYHREEVENAL